MPGIGQFVLHAMANPPLKAGDYVLEGRQSIAGGPVAPQSTHIRITSPRFSLPPDQMLSTFPPANSEGAYENRLPQIVIKRRTLPWERAPEPGADTTPWLALVVIAEGEGSLSGEVPVAECVTPGVTLSGPNDVATGIHLSVSQTVVDKVFPTREDVPLLCHVREVDIDDTELAGGDDDGFVAVVLANRLPQYDREGDRPVRYLACLVNLEGQLDVLPETPADPVFEFDATAHVFDVRDYVVEAHVDTDRFVMGGFTAQAQLAQAQTRGLAAPAPAAAQESGKRIAPVVAPSAPKEVSSEWRATEARVEHVAVSASASDAPRLVRDVMGEAFRHDIGLYVSHLERVYRFPVLAHWSFTVTGSGGFESLMRGLDVGLLGTAPAPPATPPGAPPPPPRPRPEAELAETGHVGLPHLTRRGERVRVWYRGPLVPHPTERDEPGEDGRLPLAHVSDALRRIAPDGREDLSLAGAFEIGRLLALSRPGIVRALLAWRAEGFGAERARQIALAASEEAGMVRPALEAQAAQLGALIGFQLVLGAAKDPAVVLAPSCPIADPGRPLEFARGDEADAVLAAGLGISLDRIQELEGKLGLVGALRATEVPVGRRPEGPLLRGPELERLQAGLADAVERLAADALRDRPGAPGAPGAMASPSAGDALDELIRRAGEER